jgi:hypothetical protein
MDFNVGHHDGENAGWMYRSYSIDPTAVFPKNCYMGAAKMLSTIHYPIAEEEPGGTGNN